MARPGRKGTAGTGDRLKFVEGLRGLAALYVVLGHICSMVDPSGLAGRVSRVPEWLRLAMSPFAYGHLAVAGFIVISGFCLQVSLFNNGSGRILNLRRFFARRAWRILPTYYACLGISLLVAWHITPLGKGMPFDLYLPLTEDNIWAHLLLVHNLSPDWMYKINGVLWSIPIEVQLYVLFPVLVAVLARAGRTALLALAVGASAWVLAAYPSSLKLYPWYLALFCVGMVSAHFAYRPFMRFRPRPYLGLALAAIAMAGIIRVQAEGLPMPVGDALLGLTLAGLLYAGCCQPNLLPIRALGWKPVAWLGVISYSLYLMHHPIQQALFIYRPVWINEPVVEWAYLMAVGLPAILAGCALFWYAFERPFYYSRSVSETGQRAHVPLSLPLKTVSRQTPTAQQRRRRETSPAHTGESILREVAVL